METKSTVFSLALTFFLVANPVGNSPAIIALVKNFSFSEQKKILFRESMLALALALFFQYCGEIFLTHLKIQDFAVTITGGLLLLLVAFGMIFPKKAESGAEESTKQQPFFVPIATPIISGPGLLAIIMLNSKLEENNMKITSAILIAWIGVTLILTTAPYLQKFLGKRGLIALEQVMGMVLGFISVEMIERGVRLFLKTLE